MDTLKSTRDIVPQPPKAELPIGLDNNSPCSELRPQDKGNNVDPVTKYMGGTHNAPAELPHRCKRMIESNTKVFCYEFEDMTGYTGVGGKFSIESNPMQPADAIKLLPKVLAHQQQ